MGDASDELERLSREQLILKARVLGAERAELMTRVELRDEIVRRSEPDLAERKRARGFLGVARDLVASVVEAGLNLPDAAARIRGEGAREGDWKGPPPVATVTLAEIYAAQGHLDRALQMLDEVLAREPDHDPARALRDRLAAGTDMPAPAARRRQRISFADPEPVVPVDIEPLVSDVIPSTEPSQSAVAEAIASPEVEISASPNAEPESLAASSAPESSPVAAIPATAATLESAPVAATIPAVSAESAPAAQAASVVSGGPSVITLSLAGQRQIYWEIPAQTRDSLRARFPHGRALLRVMSFRTRAGKVERQAHDLSAEPAVGSAVLPGLRGDAVVRAAFGWEADGRFQPFVIASELDTTPPSNVARSGPFRAHPLAGPLESGIEQRALSFLARRSSP